MCLVATLHGGLLVYTDTLHAVQAAGLSVEAAALWRMSDQT